MTKEGITKCDKNMPENIQPKIDLSKALKLYLSGVSQADIAKLFGVSRQAISQALKPFKVRHPEVAQAYKENKSNLINEKEMTALQAIDEDKLKKASGRDLAIIFGTLYDKNRLEQGKSTDNVMIFSRIVADSDGDL